MSQLIDVTDLVRLLGPWSARRGPRYVRLADAIQDAIHQDGIDDGALLPPERALAQSLAISRGTIVAAYGVLADRGLVERRQGSGTRVIGAGVPAIGRAHRNPQFNRIVSGLPAGIDLSVGAPYVDEVIAGITTDLGEVLRAGAPGHGYAPLGLPLLREGVAERLTARGMPTTREQLLMTTGGQGALQLLTTAFIRRGDRVIVESPSYPGAIEVFSRAGAVVVGVRRDHAGARTDDLERALAGPGAALVFLVPTCHNPTGSVMHEQRRREVLAVCERHDVLMLEDQTTASIVFEGEPPPALAALEPERVISVGSFSKSLWGGLRVGWVRASEATILRLGRLKAAHDLGSGLLDQAAALAALPRLDDVIAIRRRQAAQRHAVMVEALAEHLPEWEVDASCRGGWSLWARLPGDSADAIASAALHRGVAIGTGAASAPDDQFLDHVRLCFSAPPDILRVAVGRLAAAWEERGSARVGALVP
jgi:DNA-binding transcriptional MocR family regulator